MTDVKTPTANRLLEIQKEYLELTFQNDGYEYINPVVLEAHAHVIKEIDQIMKVLDPSYVKFNNFKLNKNGGYSARYQCYWSSSFVGVSYMEMQENGNIIHEF
jgi:hypothetical protein